MSELSEPKRDKKEGSNDALKNIRGSSKTLKQAPVLIFIAACALATTFWIARFTVPPQKTGIMQHLGHAMRDSRLGLRMKRPFVQKVLRIETPLPCRDDDPNQTLIKKRKCNQMNSTAHWRISDAKRFFKNMASEKSAQAHVNDTLDSVGRNQISSRELVEWVRSASWSIPADNVLGKSPTQQKQMLTPKFSRSGEIATRTILMEVQKLFPQCGIQRIDVRNKLLDHVESGPPRTPLLDASAPLLTTTAP